MPDAMSRDDLSESERQLASLRPSSVGLDRDRMLFEAGRASARAGARGWALGAAASALVAIGLGIGLARERSRALGLERALIAAREVPPPPTIAATPPEPMPPVEIDPDSYLALSRGAFAGLDDLPPMTSHTARDPGPPTQRRVLTPLRSRGAEGLRDL